MEELGSKLEVAFDGVVRARAALLDAKEHAISSKEKLKDQEAGLILNGMIVGKNETERSASMRSQTIKWRDDLLEAEKSERVATLALEIALDARRNLENMLKIEEIEKW